MLYSIFVPKSHIMDLKHQQLANSELRQPCCDSEDFLEENTANSEERKVFSLRTFPFGINMLFQSQVEL